VCKYNILLKLRITVLKPLKNTGIYGKKTEGRI
jgi:hypothetical protein